MGVLTEDSFDYDCCNCGTHTSMSREEFMSLFDYGGKIDSDYRCGDCADKARAEDEAKEFGGYGDLARGLKHLIDNNALSVSASGGYASISCRTPMHDGVAKDEAEKLRLQEEREQRIQKVIDSDDDWSASQINALCSAMRSDDTEQQKTTKQVLDAAIFAAIEQFEEATGCKVESAEYSCGNPYEHRNVLVRSK